jgi:hypothetical protein
MSFDTGLALKLLFCNAFLLAINIALYAWALNPLNAGAAAFVLPITIYFAMEASRG